VSEVNDLSKADSIALKQRLAGLSADQRARLIRRLGEDKSKTGSSGGSLAAIPRARPLRVEENPHVAIYPASHGQLRMWFLHHYAPESPVYCVPSAFHLVGPLNIAWLEAAFRAVIQRHDMLRTTFAMENGELFQRVAAASAFCLRQINLEEIPDDTRKASAERSLDEETCRPFDLAAGPPFRAVLLRLQPTEHVLLLVLHHIISDGWSRSNFYRELSAAYAALAADQPVPMRELPVQFADYSAWQKDWLAGGALAAQTTYWKTKLAGEPEPLDLPSDRARAATESFRGGRCSRHLNPELTAALKTRAQEEGATLFMILLAAFKTLLHRYTGHDDLIVGVPIANRQRVEVEELIGFFANTLVMRTTFPEDLTFRELLRRVQATAVEAYAHQDMPFERLVELLQVRRDASRTPLFQATFALMDYPAVELILPGIQSAPWFVTTHTSKFDFSLTLERSADGWLAVAEYSTDLFDADRVERMLEHWRVILESIMTDPDQGVSEIPLLTPAERHRLLVERNAPQTDYPEAKCVHELFEAQAARTPEAVAVVFEERRLTYAELNRRANQLAHRLRKLGVQPDTLVGICVERSLELVVGILGILKAGGAYLPLDPAYPKEWLAFMLDDARPKVVLTQQRLINSLPKNGAQSMALDSESETFINESLENPDRRVRPDQLAYVIYTSGSTGKPKGTLVTHQNIARLFQATQAWFHFGPEDVWTLFHSHAFDFSVWEMWGALCYGGRLVVVPYWVSRSPDDFYQLLNQERVTVLNQTPSAFRQLIQAEASAGRGQELALRLVILGGEVLEMQSLKPWFDRHGDQHPQLVNMYGITETTVHVTYRPLTTADLKSGSVVGIPLPDLQVYILDQHRQLLPVGVPGEMYVGGAGVTRGYLNRPELTRERFTGHPFSNEPGARLYRSGDLARYLPDGDIEYLGRIDHQVKLRGFRIELGEIETALRARPEVREAVVIVREDTPGDQRLVAYLIAHGEEKPDTPTLRTQFAETLPEYMLPNAFVWLDQLPLTPNGKVDRQSMPAPETNIGVMPGDQDQPANLLELELIRLWRRLFQRENIGRHDNFFDLGGHSLLAARLATEIDKLLGCKLPIAFLFQSPTVESLARRITGENWAPPWSSLVPLQPLGSELPVFCIHGVGGDVYGFLDLARELAPDRPVYGLQAVGLDGHQPRHTTVEEMAAHYAREIRSLKPEGPCHLVGASLGGWIAYAVAQELTRQGSKVALLGLLDTRATSNVPWHLYVRVMMPYLADRLRFHFKQCLSGPKDGRLHYLKQKLNWLRIHIARFRSNLPVRQTTANSALINPQDLLIDYFDAVATRYRPAKYAGDVTLFAGVDAKYFHHSTFWKHFVLGRVQVNLVAGGHGSIISKAHAAKFALTFKQALREAETSAGWFFTRK
jgi:amino acid adenylation domain-containing protein